MKRKRTTPGEQLFFLRRAHNWSLRELAERSGIHNSDLSRMENGLIPIGATRAVKLAKAFGVGMQRFYPDKRKAK